MSALGFLAAIALGLGQEATDNQASVLSDILVSASRDRQRPSVFTAYRQFCFEGNRRDGRASRPTQDPGWITLDAAQRERLGLAAPGVEAHAGVVGEANLLLRIEERDEGDLRRHDCSVLVTGPHDPAELEAGMNALFEATGAPPPPEASRDRGPGWRTLTWTAIPPRTSKEWSAYRPSRSQVGGFVFVISPSYYRRYTYIIAEMRSRTDGEEPITVLTFTHIFRP